MAEVSNEETELTQEFGQLVRVLTGSSMQMREAGIYRAAAKAQSDEMQRQSQEQQQREQLLAEPVNDKLRSEGLWERQNPTEIADHVIVAAHLGETNETALSGYQYASDMLRDNYGINLVEINKDHPGAWADQHAALEQALSAYYEAQQKDLEAQQHSAQSETAALQTNDTEREVITAEKDLPVRIEQQPDKKDQSEHEQLSRQSQAEAEGARQDEQVHLRAADGYAAEQDHDQKHAQQEASTGGRQPNPYQRVTDAQRDQLNAQNPGYGDTRQRQGMQFSPSSQERVNAAASSRTSGRAVKQAEGANRRVAHQKDLGVSR